jgi:3-oxoadipate enol-lactonase/4-carboxymuconolactone decarboxylase
MPFLTVGDHRIHYQFDGPGSAPVLVFSNSLGVDVTMWDAVLPRLRPHFRLLRYDTRGHGQSAVPPGPYSLDQLGGDVLSLLDGLGIEKAHFCGLSLGGLTGQWLGVYHPRRLHKLVVCNTAARIGTVESWNERIEAVRQGGVNALVPTILTRWLTDGYRTAHPDAVAHLAERIGQTSAEGYAACCAALREADLRETIRQIPVPTLVIAGQHDPVTTLADAQAIAEQVPNARLQPLRAAHLSALEAADAFADALLEFLSPTLAERYETGMATRRAVLGNAHVDRANANVTAFNADFQTFLTRYAWGEVWTRPGLPRRDRSLVTLAMLLALNRETEFKMHVRAAFTNGVTIEELKEVLLHAALYCGLPAANAAYHAAQEVLAEMNRSS